MQPIVSGRVDESSADARTSKAVAACPLCTGPVDERGRECRCRRCGFAICPGCEGSGTGLLEDRE
jgi:hypothetical protein